MTLQKQSAFCDHSWFMSIWKKKNRNEKSDRSECEIFGKIQLNVACYTPIISINLLRFAFNLEISYASVNLRRHITLEPIRSTRNQFGKFFVAVISMVISNSNLYIYIHWLVWWWMCRFFFSLWSLPIAFAVTFDTKPQVLLGRDYYCFDCLLEWMLFPRTHPPTF